METVCLAAILKYEEPFLDEWIVYHRMLGIDHFYSQLYTLLYQLLCIMTG